MSQTVKYARIRIASFNKWRESKGYDVTRTTKWVSPRQGGIAAIALTSKGN